MVKTSATSNFVRDEASASSDFLTPQKHPIGVAAGVELQDLARRPTRQGSVVVSCIDYDADNLLVQEVKDFPEFIERHRPAWSKVRWINLRGLGDMHVIRALAEKYELHPLAIEDVLTGQQRPKVDDYPGSGEHPGRLFVVAKMVRGTRQRVTSRQVSFFLGHQAGSTPRSAMCARRGASHGAASERTVPALPAPAATPQAADRG
jgi:magnesium transporter